MQMIYGMGLLGLGVIIGLHLLIFHKKIKWLNYFVWVLCTIGSFFLGGKNTHGGVLCLSVFILGLLWLCLYHNIILVKTGGKGILEYFNNEK